MPADVSDARLLLVITMVQYQQPPKQWKVLGPASDMYIGAYTAGSSMHVNLRSHGIDDVCRW